MVQVIRVVVVTCRMQQPPEWISTVITVAPSIALGFISGSDLVEASCRQMGTRQALILSSVRTQLGQVPHLIQMHAHMLLQSSLQQTIVPNLEL